MPAYKSHCQIISILFIFLGIAVNFTHADTQVAPEVASEMLAQQNAQFQQQVVKVTDNIYTAVGFHGANTSMIVGTDGVIIVDTLMGPTSAANAFKALREYSDKPVKAIIYTHSHEDHTGGASVFAVNAQAEIYATQNFGSAEGVNSAVNPIKAKRGVRQFGRMLPDDQQTNRGLAPAQTIDSDRGKGYLAPTIRMTGESYKRTIAGVDIELHTGSGETDDALFIWLPNNKVLFTGDNFYQTFPNLYAIRGTAYRDVLEWSNSLNKMADFEPEYLVPGHTLPISGKNNATTALRDYSNAIASVYQQTIAGINQGKSPDLIAHQVTLSANLSDKPYLTEFYGTIPHAVRAIYAGLLGWFDGNPTTLSPLPPILKAQNIAKLAGGIENLTQQMQSALANNEFQWALELVDHLKWLENSDKILLRASKIQALRGLAAQEYNAPNRNYYLSYANELEAGDLDDAWF